MATPAKSKRSASGPLSNDAPELFRCPACAGEVEVWPDKVRGKCISCNAVFEKTQLTDGSPVSLEEKLQALIQHAGKSGATAATIISTGDIVIDQNLADKCREPRCESYGLSKSCPPHVSGPLVLKNQLENYSHAIFFKIDVPSEVLYSRKRGELFQLLHETASGIEQKAISMGFAKAKAYAGGSCKKIFCDEHRDCRALSEEGKCRNPRYARPSMSGFGINVSKLFELSGWTWQEMDQPADAAATKTASVCGLVIVC